MSEKCEVSEFNALLGKILRLRNQIADILAILAIAKLRVASKTLLEADTVVLLAPIALTVATLTCEAPFLNLNELLSPSGLGFGRIEVLAVTTRADKWIASLSPLQTDAVLLGTLAILASAGLRRFV